MTEMAEESWNALPIEQVAVSMTEKEARHIRIKGKVINELVGSIGNCTCDRAYYERDLRDPNCVHHFVGFDELVEDLTKIIEEEA